MINRIFNIHMGRGNHQKAYIKISNLNAVDIVKFFMAIVVIAIHTHPFEHIENELFLKMYGLLCVCAVPFFFLSTGFLLARKLNEVKTKEEKEQIIKKTLFKLIKLYLIWNIVYLPLALYDYSFNNKSIFGSSFLYCTFSYI